MWNRSVAVDVFALSRYSIGMSTSCHELVAGDFVGWSRVDGIASTQLYFATCLRCCREHRTNYVGLLRCPRCHHILKRTWKGMIARCYDPDNPNYRHYGARGIAVCKRWRRSFEAFLEDMDFPIGRGFSIDRIDNDGNYEPANCRWATHQEQMMNTRKGYDVESRLPAWVDTEVAARVIGVETGTIRSYCDRKILRSKHVGRTVMVSSASVIKYMTGRKSPGRPAKTKETA